ncbi:hypothetical protein [uncultured Rhodoblastus sp.]|uniref:hypothetical protein n=1 Tax=uncultured Rhodoblastus sp. TaxID=543037 RepID=UPI0025E7265D|nr:hypothetical protein [uncultured Rhodoblastus sp.]
MTIAEISTRFSISLAVWLIATAAIAAEPTGLALNPAVTQATITETICTAGWTRTVRPYVADMKRIKAEMLAAVGEPIERRNQYELDHVVPLALGGATIDRRNLSLQPIGEAREKDAIEVCLSWLVCQGKIALEDAQSAIFEDWRQAGELCEEDW